MPSRPIAPGIESPGKGQGWAHGIKPEARYIPNIGKFMATVPASPDYPPYEYAQTFTFSRLALGIAIIQYARFVKKAGDAFWFEPFHATDEELMSAWRAKEPSILEVEAWRSTLPRDGSHVRQHKMHNGIPHDDAEPSWDNCIRQIES